MANFRYILINSIGVMSMFDLHQQIISSKDWAKKYNEEKNKPKSPLSLGGLHWIEPETMPHKNSYGQKIWATEKQIKALLGVSKGNYTLAQAKSLTQREITQILNRYIINNQ